MSAEGWGIDSLEVPPSPGWVPGALVEGHGYDPETWGHPSTWGVERIRNVLLHSDRDWKDHLERQYGITPSWGAIDTATAPEYTNAEFLLRLAEGPPSAPLGDIYFTRHGQSSDHSQLQNQVVYLRIFTPGHPWHAESWINDQADLYIPLPATRGTECMAWSVRGGRPFHAPSALHDEQISALYKFTAILHYFGMPHPQRQERTVQRQWLQFYGMLEGLAREADRSVGPVSGWEALSCVVNWAKDTLPEEIWAGDYAADELGVAREAERPVYLPRRADAVLGARRNGVRKEQGDDESDIGM